MYFGRSATVHARAQSERVTAVDMPPAAAAYDRRRGGAGAFRASGTEAAPGIVNVRICGIFRAARSWKTAGWRTITAPPPSPPPTHPDFLNICHKPRGSVSARETERKTLCDLGRRCADGSAKGRDEA